MSQWCILQSVIMRPNLKTRAFILTGLLCLVAFAASADDFTKELSQADAAVKSGNTRHALDIYQKAQTAAAGNCPELCVLCRRYSDLMHQTPFIAAQKDLLTRAFTCAQDAVKAGPKNPTAHASLAVCYAKECQFADTKTSLVDSRLFKSEAELAIHFDPEQDVAWYLLGRWNYAIANVGLLSRTYVRVVYGRLPAASNADAIANFKAAIAIAPEHVLYHESLAEAYKTIGDKKSALAEWQKCLALVPLDPDDLQAKQQAVKALRAK
jgi:tetratricopeptide (TPR) repeat protein